MAQDPLWDEEVVPALRKRLQSESKTIARRLSAISLPSGDEARPVPGPKVLNPQKHHLAQVQQPQPQHQPVQAKPKAQTLRQRTYSSPKNPHPTRIPKARQISGGSSSGSGHSRPPLPQSQENTPKPKPIPPSDSRSTFDMPRSHTRGLGLLHESPPFPINSMSSSSSVGGELYSQARPPGQRYGLGLGRTPTQARTEERSQAEDDDPPRPSIDSEERPYEHWYRGEVSRNGGVGELKVGRRQEMLDIANYGHLIQSRKVGGANGGMGVSVNGKGVGGGSASRENGYLDLLKLRRTRPRAGSIGGLTRKERDSLFLDEIDEDEIGVGGLGWRDAGSTEGVWGERVLDQDPPTDFDKDDDDEEEEEEDAEDGVGENDDNEEGTPMTRQEDEGHISHNFTHNLNHNHKEEQEEDDDFVIVNHDPHHPYPYAYAYIPTEADILNVRSSTSDSMTPTANVHVNGTPNTNTPERWTPTAGAHQTQKTATYPTSTTIPPTAASIPPLPRPSSRQTQTSPPPSRIPHPSSSSRRSSDSRSTHNSTSTPTPTTTTTVPRATTPTSILPRPTRSKSDPPGALGGPSASTSNSASTPPHGALPPPSSFNKRSASPGSTSTSSSPSPQTPTTTKKGATIKSRTKPTKAKSKSKSKPPPTKREEKKEKRSSVAMYPTVEGGEELADAIPSWTQPITREGNWDDVVLPVVARKKGLEGYYEDTNPHLQLKMRQANGGVEKVIAPAPGTFGFDHSKYRPPRVGEDAEGDEFVELDEFGVSNPPPPLDTGDDMERAPHKRHEEEESDTYVVPNPNPNRIQMQVQVQMSNKRVEKVNDERDKGVDEDAGCCKCVVM